MLGGELTAMIAVIITFIWSVFGTNTIIFITGMATLDRDVYEAARVRRGERRSRRSATSPSRC